MNFSWEQQDSYSFPGQAEVNDLTSLFSVVSEGIQCSGFLPEFDWFMVKDKENRVC